MSRFSALELLELVIIDSCQYKHKKEISLKYLRIKLDIVTLSSYCDTTELLFAKAVKLRNGTKHGCPTNIP